VSVPATHEYLLTPGVCEAASRRLLGKCDCEACPKAEPPLVWCSVSGVANGVVSEEGKVLEGATVSVTCNQGFEMEGEDVQGASFSAICVKDQEGGSTVDGVEYKGILFPHMPVCVAVPPPLSPPPPSLPAPLSVEECCATVCKGEGSEEPADAPAEAPAPPPPPPPAEANVCTMQADGSCKSMLNMYCGQWRDSADTMSSSKQKQKLEMCMAQDCQQSMESGHDTPGCRFLDSNGFCFAYNSAQTWCGGAGTGSPFCTDGGKGWAQPPLGNADSSQTGWVPGTFPYRGGSTDKGSLECMCMKDCTCSEQKCFCVDKEQAPVGPVRIQSS